MMRGIFSGLAGFTLAGVILAAIFGRVLPDDLSADAYAATGVFGALLAGAVAGAAGAWQGPPVAGVAAAALAALALVATQPQADLITAVSLIAVLVGATAGALLSPLGSRRRGSRRGSARSPLRA